MPCPGSCPRALLALALLAHFSRGSQAGGRRALPENSPPGAQGRTLLLLDVSAKSPVRVTSENFLSLQLDPSVIHDGWLDFLSSRRLVTLARGLAPAFLRFAGKRTDFLHFHNVKNPAKSRGGPGPDYYLKNYEDDIVRSDIALDKQKGCKIAQHPDIMLELQREKAAQMHLVLLKEQFSNTYSNLTLTARSLDKLYNFADCSGLHLIFALNALCRNPNNSWDSSNALSLLKYSASKKYNISWELGNEPNNYRTLTGHAVNGSQLGKDYLQLKSLLQPIRTYARASLYGPNTGRPRKNVLALLEGYYLDGRVAKVTDFLRTRLLDTLSDQIRKIQKVVNTYAPGKKIWLEGIGATSAGGTNNLSDSYAAGFLWLNALGMLASQGIEVVMRHSFFDHGHNHLVDQNFNPLPVGLLAVAALQASGWAQGAGRPRGRASGEATAWQGYSGQAPHLRTLHQPPQPALCARLHHPLHHQPAPLPEENQAGGDAAGQGCPPVPASARGHRGAPRPGRAAQRAAAGHGRRWDATRAETSPPPRWPHPGHPTAEHELLRGEKRSRLGLPVPVALPERRCAGGELLTLWNLLPRPRCQGQGLGRPFARASWCSGPLPGTLPPESCAATGKSWAPWRRIALRRGVQGGSKDPANSPPAAPGPGGLGRAPERVAGA
ncbi:inactive heparanase-2 isoform X2 [Carettochelys insculpta]|uniref:inactive heparanase-2 isoform X2 n=1 Tax=Carettochelys insculpta TaxID=44489 RepID=UPI003EB6E12F